ncbi:hypothetical protein GCK72_012156 [Caenorhabditis remanei]|uniref:Uncharacterized protein n=1 Tax=Caenorhabditis remanei TaxID=31234 RepID=A0A6A5GM45_CAERE|nr:hypothetical protein GCK72_012156 [Caenorhabditis remanei]KAF1755706.1 hypothetical protein GCK72_012156 [Caenorhabditis remanei]
MSLTADPPACQVPAAGGASTHKLVNGTPEKLIFKTVSLGAMGSGAKDSLAMGRGIVKPSGCGSLALWPVSQRTREPGANGQWLGADWSVTRSQCLGAWSP